MKRVLAIVFAWVALLSCFGQGPVRRVPTVPELMKINPYSVAQSGVVTYLVEAKDTNTPWGSPRAAVWTSSTNATPNGTNVLGSAFGGRWIFPDVSAPIQDARWWNSASNRWALDASGNLWLTTTNVAAYLSYLNGLVGSSAAGKVDIVSGFATNLALAGSIRATNIGSDLSGGSGHRVLVRNGADNVLRPMDPAVLKGFMSLYYWDIGGLGDSATKNVGTSAGMVAAGDHNHDGRYDTNGAATSEVATHTAAANPHTQYLKRTSDTGSNLTFTGTSTVNGTMNLASIGADLSSGGSHRLLVRDAATGDMRPMTIAYTKGWLDFHAADIIDAGTAGQTVLKKAAISDIWDYLTSGSRTTNVYLRGDLVWATPPAGASATNGITEAPVDGTFYGRKDAAWVNPSIDNVSGWSTFGKNWAKNVTSAGDGLTQLTLTGGGAATIDSPSKHNVRVNSTGTGTPRHRLNVIGGQWLSAAVSDDSVDDESDVTLAVADGDKGDFTISSGTATIDAAAVTYSKIQNVTASRLLGQGSAGSGPPQEITPGAGLLLSGTTLSVDPAYYLSGSYLYVAAGEVALSGTDFTDEGWHNIAGTAKTGTSKTIPAGALATGTVLKIEAAGVMQYVDTSIAKVRLVIGGLTVTFDWNEVYVEDADLDSPWNIVVYLTVKTTGASATVLTSGYWDWAPISTYQTRANYQFRCRAATTGTLDTTGSNAVSMDFYGTDTSGRFNKFVCNQVIVQRL